MAQPITVSPEALAERVSRIFLAAGLSPLQAETLAATIVAGERDSCKSHGIYRIEGCLRTVAAGKVQIGLDAAPASRRAQDAFGRIGRTAGPVAVEFRCRIRRHLPHGQHVGIE